VSHYERKVRETDKLWAESKDREAGNMRQRIGRAKDALKKTENQRQGGNRTQRQSLPEHQLILLTIVYS
jgi:hypothetical protein